MQSRIDGEAGFGVERSRSERTREGEPEKESSVREMSCHFDSRRLPVWTCLGSGATIEPGSIVRWLDHPEGVSSGRGFNMRASRHVFGKCTFHRRLRVSRFVFVAILGCAFGGPAPCQEAFLSWDFEDGDLDDFFNPTGMEAIDNCGTIAPAGTATADSGELVLENDAFYGITIVTLRPEIVAASFPSSREYTLRVRVQPSTVGEAIAFLRSRLGLRIAQSQVDSTRERGYGISLFTQGTEADKPDGFLGIGEIDGCHEIVDHPEWPGGSAEGYARIDLGYPVLQDEWYWIEAGVQGDDDEGPVRIAVRAWPDGEEPPLGYLAIVTDTDGLNHTAETLTPETECQVAFANSLDSSQAPGASSTWDDVSLTEIAGCVEPPIRATRRLWEDRVLAEGAELVVYETGQMRQVTIELTEPRVTDLCPGPLGVRIVETVPAGWTIGSVSGEGRVVGHSIEWDIVAPLGDLSLTYEVTPSGDEVATFQGVMTEKGATRWFLVEGADSAVTQSILPPVGDFGSIQNWLILGPFTRQVGGANPGDAQLARDYLTDGDTTEKTIQPRAGDTIQPDFGGAAASTGLAPNSLGRNPGGEPTWIEWRDFDDTNDRIDFESVYGPVDEVMCHAMTYLHALEPVTVNFGISSDDSVQVLLDGKELHRNNVARGALDRIYVDTPFTHPKLGNVELAEGWHTLLVKVFEGGGQHNFRVGFLDESGLEIPGGPAEIEIALEPEVSTEPVFRRGDINGDGEGNISDGIFGLNFLFLGGASPGCLDAADVNDDGQVNISDPINILNFLFLGGVAPPAPGPASCGEDPTKGDPFVDCVYERC
jgi:hypothetical protein